MPFVEIQKHFFARHLVVQAKITNVPYTSGGSSTLTGEKLPTLTDVAFVVAESSQEEAIQPMLQVPVQTLPPKGTGCAWCVLSATPTLMDGPTAQLTCELRYAVQAASSSVMARTFVEELQDLEVHATHFS